MKRFLLVLSCLLFSSIAFAQSPGHPPLLVDRFSLPATLLLGQTPVPPGPPVPTLRFDQGVCSVTTAAVISPSIQNNACSGGGVPNRVLNPNTNYCLYTVGSASNLNWVGSFQGANPTTGTGGNYQVWTGPGLYSVQGRQNNLSMKFIAASATVTVFLTCGY